LLILVRSKSNSLRSRLMGSDSGLSTPQVTGPLAPVFASDALVCYFIAVSTWWPHMAVVRKSFFAPSPHLLKSPCFIILSSDWTSHVASHCSRRRTTGRFLSWSIIC
jgi:hypothetical protein